MSTITEEQALRIEAEGRILVELQCLPVDQTSDPSLQEAWGRTDPGDLRDAIIGVYLTEIEHVLMGIDILLVFGGGRIDWTPLAEDALEVRDTTRLAAILEAAGEEDRQVRGALETDLSLECHHVAELLTNTWADETRWQLV